MDDKQTRFILKIILVINTLLFVSTLSKLIQSFSKPDAMENNRKRPIYKNKAKNLSRNGKRMPKISRYKKCINLKK